MGNMHVSQGLDPNQRIFKPVSFYDLIELMTFSQITFGRLDHIRLESQPSTAAQPTKAVHIMHQTWGLLEHENTIDWDQSGTSEPALYLISSVGALST